MNIPTKTEIIIPKPYLKIAFGCTNRAFYSVKSELYSIAENVGIEACDHMEEICDYEGDLEKIRVYRTSTSEPFVEAILKHYGLVDTIPEEMEIMLSIF